MNTTELLIANGQLVVDTLRHLAENEIDSDYFAITTTSENGTEIEHELVITDYALQAASTVEALVEALESAQAIRAAAEKLVRCKGRYHSEQNYRALAALFGVTTPDLPPMSEDTQTVVVIPPAYVDGITLGYGEVNHMIDLCVDSFERACHAVGIKCEVKGE
ncbi:hypothetical protein [Atlantibacter hermannii]|uniref:hypothetical protein n=1 Tax=Atlantibacter hermannii TaxID=565 RepID=UPI0028AC825B|nr:hypothetical protein [Atlantibacter hermannii]